MDICTRGKKFEIFFFLPYVSRLRKKKKKNVHTLYRDVEHNGVRRQRLFNSSIESNEILIRADASGFTGWFHHESRLFPPVFFHDFIFISALFLCKKLVNGYENLDILRRSRTTVYNLKSIFGIM